MSADTTIAFYGIRLEMSDDDVEQLEERTHPAIVKARKAKLQTYWGNFGVDDDQFSLLIGKELGKLGVEDSAELSLNMDQLTKIASDVSTKLSAAGFKERPALLIHYQPDY